MITTTPGVEKPQNCIVAAMQGDSVLDSGVVLKGKAMLEILIYFVGLLTGLVAGAIIGYYVSGREIRDKVVEVFNEFHNKEK